MPDNFYVGGGVAETAISPIAAAILLLSVAGILFLPRKHAIALVLMGALLIPPGNILVLAGVHLLPVRVISLFGIVRLLRSKLEAGPVVFVGGINSIDRAVLGWALAHVAAFTLLWHTSGALVNQCGFLLGSLGIYFLLRYLVREERDVRNVIRVLAIVAAVNAAEMVYEQFSGHNLFSLLGGATISVIREGHVRAQGAFAHPLLAGAFGGVTLPLFAWLWKSERKKLLPIIGCVSSAVMALCTWSSTPLFVLLGGIGAICLWPIRYRMRELRWGIVLTLLALQLLMKAPVWFLIQRVELSGTSGYHRAILVDNFIRHFGDWWLIGTKSMSTWDYETWDTSNEFVSQGETGGLLTFIFFLAIICRGFRKLGRARMRTQGDSRREWCFWLLGVAMFANILAYFGVSYWDQTQAGWFAFLTIISATTIPQVIQGQVRKAKVIDGAIVTPGMVDLVPVDSAE
jgi:hypothetical protein